MANDNNSIENRYSEQEKLPSDTENKEPYTSQKGPDFYPKLNIKTSSFDNPPGSNITSEGNEERPDVKITPPQTPPSTPTAVGFSDSTLSQSSEEGGVVEKKSAHEIVADAPSPKHIFGDNIGSQASSTSSRVSQSSEGPVVETKSALEIVANALAPKSILGGNIGSEENSIVGNSQPSPRVTGDSPSPRVTPANVAVSQKDNGQTL